MNSHIAITRRTLLRVRSLVTASLAVTIWVAAPVSAAAPTTDEAGPARRVERFRLTETHLKTLREAPREVREAIIVDGGVVQARRGFTLYVDAVGMVFIVGADLNQPTVNPRPVKGGDRVFIEPGNGGPNSGWMMIVCDCRGRADEDCTLVKDANGNLVVDQNNEVQCDGDECCEVTLMGVTGGGTTVHVTGGVSM